MWEEESLINNIYETKVVMNEILSFKERQKLLFEASNRYKKRGYKLVTQRNYSLRMKATPIYSRKMKLNKKISLLQFSLFGRSLINGPRKEFIDINIDMYGNITVTETN